MAKRNPPKGARLFEVSNLATKLEQPFGFLDLIGLDGLEGDLLKKTIHLAAHLTTAPLEGFQSHVLGFHCSILLGFGWNKSPCVVFLFAKHHGLKAKYKGGLL